MTATDPRPAPAAKPAASQRHRPKPGKGPSRREAFPSSGRGAQRNASEHARIQRLARKPEPPRTVQKKEEAAARFHDIA